MEDVARALGRVAANGIELAYETFGDPGAPPVVLIMGLATQMIAWPDELCQGLARRGARMRSCASAMRSAARHQAEGGQHA
jgi:pimeloyl-ACP methyl ester carboxylesterase